MDTSQLQLLKHEKYFRNQTSSKVLKQIMFYEQPSMNQFYILLRKYISGRFIIQPEGLSRAVLFQMIS